MKTYVERQFTKILQNRASVQDFIFAKEFRGRQGYKPGACVPALEIAKSVFFFILFLLKHRAYPSSMLMFTCEQTKAQGRQAIGATNRRAGCLRGGLRHAWSASHPFNRSGKPVYV